MMMTPERRRALLDECFDLKERWQAHELAASRDSAAAEAITSRLAALSEEYRVGLSRLELSRCPHCGAPVSHPIDAAGIDGLWWDHDHPIRPDFEPPCAHYFAFTGAMRLDRSRVHVNPLLVVPGPEVPFVVSRVLEGHPVTAVISTVAIGAHVGFPIFYFADPIPGGIRRINTWGTRGYRVRTADGGVDRGEAYDLDSAYDFSLAPWLEQGRVLYIEPGDEQLELRAGTKGCPYLDLPGRRQTLHVQRGNVWGSARELLG